MVQVNIIDTSSVTITGDNGTLAVEGPAQLYAVGVTDGTNSFATGYVVVQDSTATRIFNKMTGTQQDTFTAIGVIMLVLGLIAGRFGYAK